ncbi:hypothetical protein GCM10010177_61760 [Actinomadura citrea]|nr:hypothetical protein GCM10010177_61760 [Actinomadura citrea]
MIATCMQRGCAYRERRRGVEGPSCGSAVPHASGGNACGTARSRRYGEDERPMLCLTCHRVRPAASRADYTAERASLIVRQGLCVCSAPSTRPRRQAPVRKGAPTPK